MDQPLIKGIGGNGTEFRAGLFVMPDAIRALIVARGCTKLGGHDWFHASGHSPGRNFRAIYNILAMNGVLALCFHTMFFLILAGFSQRAIYRG